MDFSTSHRTFYSECRQADDCRVWRLGTGWPPLIKLRGTNSVEHPASENGASGRMRSGILRPIQGLRCADTRRPCAVGCCFLLFGLLEFEGGDAEAGRGQVLFAAGLLRRPASQDKSRLSNWSVGSSS